MKAHSVEMAAMQELAREMSRMHQELAVARKDFEMRFQLDIKRFRAEFDRMQAERKAIEEVVETVEFAAAGLNYEVGELRKTQRAFLLASKAELVVLRQFNNIVTDRRVRIGVIGVLVLFAVLVIVF